MVEEREGSEWVFRRDSVIRRPSETVTWLGVEGIRVLKPEIQLLYKAKDVRNHDQLDFERVLPHLSDAACTWLASALHHVHPGHAWLVALDAGRQK
jgi:hypothetical protein